MIEEPYFSEAGILSGAEISEQVTAGRIKLDPELDDSRLNPASYDLTLGSKVAVYKEAVSFVVGGMRYELAEDGIYRSHTDAELKDSYDINLSVFMDTNPSCILDAKKKHEIISFDMHSGGWLLKPGIGYLMHTADRICTDYFVPVLDGKSSLGRLFMTAHVTAGYGDPGFDGQYTLEVVVTQPVIVYPGMRFCQIRFHTLVGRRADYKKAGHYVGQLAEGPVASMSWKQFEEQK